MRVTAALVLLLLVVSLGCGSRDTGVRSDLGGDGPTLYAKLCALCHGGRGQGYAVELAPALRNQDFLAAVSDEFLSHAIARGRPGTKMSAWSVDAGGPLTNEQIEALVDFIRGWRTAPKVGVDDVRTNGSPSGGGQTFRARCARCHGARGEGGSAPSLTNPEFLSAASDGFIRHAIAKGRRGTPMAAYEDRLTAQEIDDLTAFIRSWAR
jgi:cytochrome c oxidase cbb3-type subunit 3/ubiquinol-cytochrome c reductase cytochrome c subunit